MIRNLLLLLIKTIFSIITFLLIWCMHSQNKDSTSVTSQKYIWHPITNKLYSLNCWYSVVYKKSCSQLVIFISFSIEKIIIPCSYCALFVPPNLCTPTKSDLYLANSLAAVINEPALYRLLTFQVPNLISLFRCLGRTRVSIQVRGFVCDNFVTKSVLTGRSY